MSRNLSNWIDSYLEYLENTESARVFHLWTAISIISTVLRRKVRFDLGSIEVYPNIYSVLVAEPGIARKTQAIRFGRKFLDEVQTIHMSADATTKEALTRALANSVSVDQDSEGFEYRHCSLSIISDEFQSFTGHKKENHKMLVSLTDLFDCPDKWKYEIKGQGGSDFISNAYLVLHAATTPGSLADSLPSSAIGGGLSSRILFIWAPKAHKKCPIPDLGPYAKQRKSLLMQDLFDISKIIGVYDFNSVSKEFWIEWYNNYDTDPLKRICKDHAFATWYSRKGDYVIKVAMCLAAAESDTLIITKKHFKKAIKYIEKIEKTMGNAFQAVGKSTITSEVAMVVDIIRKRGKITGKDLMSMIWRDVDQSKFENVINTAIQRGIVGGGIDKKTEEMTYFYKGE